MILADILKDSSYKLTQFSADKIKTLEDNIIFKPLKDREVPYIKCLVRKKEIKLTHVSFDQ